MNNRAVSISLIMALAAVFFVYDYVSTIEDAAKKKFGVEVQVLVAKRDIKEMESVLETMVEFVNVPKKFQEPGAVVLEAKEGEEKPNQKITTLKGVVGTVALVPIKKGEQISYSKITEPSLKTGLSPQVAPGRRAISIPVNEISGVSKLIKPGDRVDLIVVVDPGGGKENKLVKTLFQDLVILATGHNITNNVARVIELDPLNKLERPKSLAEDFSFSTVTLEAEPQQVQGIALLASNSDNYFVLSLRNNEDNDRPQLPTLSIGDVLGPDGARVRPPQGRR